MSDLKGKKVTITVGKTDFDFLITLMAFNTYQNEFMPHNKVAPSENFLKRCLADKAQEKALEEICDQGLALTLAQMLAEEFSPEIEITVKK